jgi:hypothetical protein
MASQVTLRRLQAPFTKKDVALLFLVPFTHLNRNTEIHAGIHTASATAITAADVLHKTRALISPFLNFMGVF